MQIENNAMVTLRCVVSDESDRVLDDGSETFSYRHGCGMLLGGVEEAIAGASAGNTIAVELPPEAAYGAYREELMFEAMRENLPPDVTLEPGMTLRSTGGPFPLTVVRLTERGAILDGNHPLAGRTLRFRVDVLDVQPALAGCASVASCSSQCSGSCPR